MRSGCLEAWGRGRQRATGAGLKHRSLSGEPQSPVLRLEPSVENFRVHRSSKPIRWLEPLPGRREQALSQSHISAKLVDLYF